MRALVIDDDVYCLDITSEYFRYKGFDVTAQLRPTCPAMEQGAEICPVGQPHFDIIISDNRMPGMTGLEFFALLEQKKCRIPASHKALLSGDLTQEEFSKAVECGYKVFRKPCPLELLDRWLDDLLG